MSTAVRRACVFPVVLLWLIAGGEGCNSNRAAAFAQDEMLSWQSARVRALEEEYDQLWKDNAAKQAAHLGPGKVLWVETYYACKRLFAQRLSYQDLRDLAASCDTLPIRFYDRQAGFSALLLEYSVEAFAAMGDRDELVTLLSTRFVSIRAGERIEEYLAAEEFSYQEHDFRGNRLKDAILVLGEAYSRCKTPEVRAEIAAAVRRAFWGLEIPGKDDAEFVANAMRWYDERKEHLAFDHEYSRNESGFLSDSGKVPDLGVCTRPGGRVPLFKKTNEARSDTGKVIRVLVIWLIHFAIAAILCAPIVFFGRKRVHWRSWELLAVILPFSVWLLLMMSPLSMGRKTLGNIGEPFYFALGVPIAAIVRVSIGPPVVRQRLLIAAIIGTLCLVAAAIFFFVPPVLPWQ
ncbi:MAG: hypothetical protein ACYC35_15055 [Pirellulales bacterium]